MNERGIAFLTVMMLLLVLTVLGIGAMTVTSLENRMAGFVRVGEAASTAAESCLGTGVNVIVQTIDQGNVPNALLDNATPAGPVPVSNQTKLTEEIHGGPPDPDLPTTAPNLVMTVPGSPNYAVTGDIDYLYMKYKAGGDISAGCASGACETYYRIDCRANNVATGTMSRVVAVYGCLILSPTCQRKPF